MNITWSTNIKFFYHGAVRSKGAKQEHHKTHARHELPPFAGCAGSGNVPWQAKLPGYSVRSVIHHWDLFYFRRIYIHYQFTRAKSHSIISFSSWPCSPRTFLLPSRPLYIRVPPTSPKWALYMPSLHIPFHLAAPQSCSWASSVARYINIYSNIY